MPASQINFDGQADQVTRPWRTAIRNSAAALLPIAIGGIKYVLFYHGLNNDTAWWVWFVVAAVVIAVCFGNALVGRIIGTRRSDLIFKLVLAIALVAGTYWLCHTLDAHMK